MTRRIEHRSTSHRPARHLHAALVDPEYLRARLIELGGNVAELVSHSVTAEEVHFRTRQRFPMRKPPVWLRPVLPENAVLERSEAWRERNPGHFTGEVAAVLRGLPGSVTGSMWLRDLGTDGDEHADSPAEEPDSGGLPPVSEFLLRGEVRVKPSLLAGKPEELFERRVRILIDQECEFTNRWMSEGH